MDIEVIKVLEDEDGSATMELKMDEEAKTLLLNFAFIQMLKNANDEFEAEFLPKENV